jgi:urease accessory protein
MARDSKTMRGERPFVFCDLKKNKGLADIVAWIEREVMFATASGVD